MMDDEQFDNSVRGTHVVPRTFTPLCKGNNGAMVNVAPMHVM
jgi:hypothetical protein